MLKTQNFDCTSNKQIIKTSCQLLEEFILKMVKSKKNPLKYWQFSKKKNPKMSESSKKLTELLFFF